MEKSQRRVVITGMGVCTPLGLEVEIFWNNLLEGKSVIRDVSYLKPVLNTGTVQIGSLFEPEQTTPDSLGVDKKEARNRMSYFSMVSFNAAREAVEQSGLFSGSNNDEIRERTGAVIAGGFGGITDIEKNAVIAYDEEKGIRRVDRFIAAKAIPGSAAAYIGSYYQIHAGDFPSITTACASGASSIIYGYKDIVLGDADAYICGGTGDPSAITFAGFDRLGALSKQNDAPDTASRPFDQDRTGFILGEGAGVVVLEELEHAKKRGAVIYGELIGYGARGDGAHPTAPREDACYSVQAMKQALNKGGINPEDVGYINAHGTSTKANDKLESFAIKKAFGDHGFKVPVNSTKSMIGHTLNAGGTIESIVALKTMQEGKIHQTRNLINPDCTPENEDYHCNLNFVKSGETLEGEVNYALSNSAAFGGRNVCLLFGKYNG